MSATSHGRAAAWALTTVTLLGAPAMAQQEEDEAPLSLQDLQRQIDALRESHDTIPVTGSSRASMKIFGRLHTDVWVPTSADESAGVFESGDPALDPQTNVEFRRARIGVSGDVDTDMTYKLEIDFGKGAGLVFKDMVFGWKDLGLAQKVLIGNQKRPYGLDHLNSSRYNVFMERPFVIESFNQDSRRLGVQSYGLSDDQAWNWRYGVFNQTDIQGTGQYVSDTLQPEIAARLANTALFEDDGRRYVHWAVSGTSAYPDGNVSENDASNEARFRTRPEARTLSRWINTGRISEVDQYSLVGLEGVTNCGPLQVTAEAQGANVDRGGGNPNPFFWGGYIYASYFLTGEHMPWDRKNGILGRPKPRKNFRDAGGLGAWQVAARYSYADFTDEGVAGGVGRSITLGLNWYWNPNASVQFNYIFGDISGRQEDPSTPTSSPLFEADYEFFGMRLRIDF